MALHEQPTGLDLRLEVQSSGGKDAAPFRTSVMQVQLRREWMGYREPGERTVILDFARRRRLGLDEEARTYTEDSLYASVGARHIELPNREYVRSVIAAGGGDASGFEPVLAEHQLSVLDKTRGRTIARARPSGLGGLLRSVVSGPERSDITLEVSQERTAYATATGRPLLSHSSEGTGAAPGLVRQFVRFLRYRYYGHPLILDQLASGSRIPREFRYDSVQPFGHPGSTLILRLDSAETVPDAAFSLDGYRRVMEPSQGPPIDTLLERVVLGETVPGTQDVVARRLAESEESRQAGRDFESVLALIELRLETDRELPSFSGVMQTDAGPQGRRLHALMEQWPDNKERARAGLATLHELRLPAGRKAHILMTFEAVLQRSIGEPDAARKLLIEALEQNPFLTGAYKDLGDIYLRAYRTGDAWRCWEAARRIAPKHPMLKDVTALEEMLASTHPEYF